MRISIIGQPGAGKTTLTNLLSGIFNVPHISSGDLARSSGFAGSDAEKSGRLDPDEAKVRGLVMEAIGDKESYILDGFPRMIEQIEDVKVPLDAVLYLDISLDPTIGKDRLLQRARPDDTQDIIDARVTTYIECTAPLVPYFDKKKMLLHINAVGSMAHTLRQAVVQMAEFGVVEASHEVNKLIKEWEHDKKGSKNRKSNKGDK